MAVQVYVDMDGVLADFDRHYFDTFRIKCSKEQDNVNWDLVRRVPDFYAGIPPMEDMFILWGYLERLKQPPIVLTGIPNVAIVPNAADNKRGWVAEHVGPSVQVICCRSRDKSLHMQPGDLLIDDWEKHQQAWIDRGGLWITHKSAANTISRLIDMGIGTGDA